MSSLLDQFLDEGSDLLGAATAGLLDLEQDASDPDVINDVFRAAHTFKGSSALFELPALTNAVHAAEDVLDAVRAGKLAVGGDLVDELMVSFDLAGDFLSTIQETGALPADADERAATASAALRARLGPQTAALAETVGADEPGDLPAWALALIVTPTTDDLLAVTYTPHRDCFFRGEDPLALVRQVPDLRELRVEHEGEWPALEEFDEYDCRIVLRFLTGAGRDELDDVLRYVEDEVEAHLVPAGTAVAVDPAIARLLAAQRGALAAALRAEDPAPRIASVALVVERALVAGGDLPAEAATAITAARAGDGAPMAAWLKTLADAGAPAGDPAPADAGPAPDAAGAPPAANERREGVGRTLKVEQSKVDRLMELVGELIVAKNALPYIAEAIEDEADARPTARALKDQYATTTRIAEELQSAVMDIRMLPMEVVFGRFRRLVRDISRRLGKDVTLVTAGEDTQADKDILEQVADPLMHLVRNSLDHGIELPDAREAAGKPRGATLTLSASQDAGGVVVEVRDDGGGVDVERVKRKAYERGLIDEEQLEAMGHEEAVDLIFRPGFSTAEQVSDLSGRGVGMDAVRTAIQRLGGSVTITSEPGRSTTVRLRLPLSMAVTQVMVVEAGDQRLGVPLDLVEETVRIPRGDLQRVAGIPAFSLRDKVVPVVDLADALELPRGAAAGQDEPGLLVVRVAGRRVALVVDAFHGSSDLVVKPPAGVLRGIPALAGTAVLGDGGVLLVLDLLEVLHAPQAR